MNAYRIGQLACAAGVSVATVRYYEARGLLAPARRSAAGYRLYGADAVARLQFVRRSQAAGFSLRETAELLALRATPESTCAQVRARAAHKLAEVDRRIAELERIRAALRALVDRCEGEGPVSECPILEALEGSDRE